MVRKTHSIPIGFIGMGVPKIGLWQSWCVTGPMTGEREVSSRVAMADARQIALSHVHNLRPCLVNEWSGMDHQDRVPAAVLGAVLAQGAVGGDRRALHHSVGGLRLLLRSDFFWVEAVVRGRTYDISIHALPKDLREAGDAFAVHARSRHMGQAAE